MPVTRIQAQKPRSPCGVGERKLSGSNPDTSTLTEESMKTTYMEIHHAQGGNCFYCKRPMSFSRGNGPSQFTLDHFDPKCNGNKTNDNIVLAHPKCNFEKGGRKPTDAERVRFKRLYDRIKRRKSELADVTRDYTPINSWRKRNGTSNS